MKDKPYQEKDPWPKPPAPPDTIATLAGEMLGCLSSCPQLYQGALRYWLMWRLPQILQLLRGEPGLKFHYCTSQPQDLFRDFTRIFMLSDVLVIGQSGPLLCPEILHFLHDFDKTWPNVDGTHGAMQTVARKPDRPLPDEIAPFLQYFFAPFAMTGRILYAPFSTMLAGRSPNDGSFEAAIAKLDEALSRTANDGLSFGFSLKQRIQEAKRELYKEDAPESIPLMPDNQAEDDDKLIDRMPNRQAECRQGRFVNAGEVVPLVDPRWKPADILAFEFYLSRYFDTMMLVSGQWAGSIPTPSHHLDLRIPYVEGIPPEALAQAIYEDPGGFKKFHQTISTALSEVITSSGSEQFIKELKRIQKDIVDDGVAKLGQKWREMMKIRFARFGAYTSAAVGIEIGLYTGSSIAEVALKLATTAATSAFIEIAQRYSEKHKLKEQPMHFIWKLK